MARRHGEGHAGSLTANFVPLVPTHATLADPEAGRVETGPLNPAACLQSATALDVGVAGLDAWFETIRGPDGYGGPVVHWWQQSLVYCGAGLDWRYEGIIAGYLHLWERTDDKSWLKKARRAGDDLVNRQLESGHFPASAFEINPATAGTPHEASCDAGLLRLALALRNAEQTGWEKYVVTAENNLRAFYLGKLWHVEAQAFMDSPFGTSFVPNKAAAACEALLLLTEIIQDSMLVSRYVVPTLNHILSYQVRDTGRLDGGIAQNSLGLRRVEKYFPIYIARCVPALLTGYQWAHDERYVDAALRAMQFIARWTDADGSIPTVIYAEHRASRYPSWIAPLGDVLRAADNLRDFGVDIDFSGTLDRLLAGRDESGGIQTATGFEGQAGGRLSEAPDARDVLHVAGWCDKAFRYLASHAAQELPVVESRPFETACVFRGQPMWLSETPEMLEISWQGRVCYRWRKGTPWPEVASPEFWLR